MGNKIEIKPNSDYVMLPENSVKVQSFEDIKKAKRLFYQELYNHNKPTGRWIEIFDVNRFVRQEEYFQKNNINRNCSDKRYIDHHNFHVVF